MIAKGQVVVADGASAILGDVLSVDEAEGSAVIAWRATTTTEQMDDLRPVFPLRPLSVGERVAHREDHDWQNGEGVVTAALGGERYAVKFPDFHKPQEHDRGDLVAMDDPDVKTGTRD